jgi:hypothetical protein
LVLADEDQALAAEPGFHRGPPKGGGTEVKSIRRVFEYNAELAEQQPDNPAVLRLGRISKFERCSVIKIPHVYGTFINTLL